MRIEYLAQGAPDCPLIRIFGTSTAEFFAFQTAVEELVSGTSLAKDLHKIEGFQVADMSGLTIATNRDIEGVQEKDAGRFYWFFPEDKWEIIAGLIDPFTKRNDGFPRHQWLCGREALFGLNASKISVVISDSPQGQW